MRCWFDTEFDEKSSLIQLISIGIVAEDGRYYAVIADYDDSVSSPWLREHVLSYLDVEPRSSREQIRREVLEFFHPHQAKSGLTLANMTGLFCANWSDICWIGLQAGHFRTKTWRSFKANLVLRYYLTLMVAGTTPEDERDFGVEGGR